MAENERLDVLRNRRWLRLMRFIASNPHEGDVTRRLTEAMYRTLRGVGKQIPLEDLLKAAASRQSGFEAAVARCRSHRHGSRDTCMAHTLLNREILPGRGVN